MNFWAFFGAPGALGEGESKFLIFVVFGLGFDIADGESSPKYNFLEVRLTIFLLVRGGLVRGYIFFSGEVGEVPGRVTLVLPFLSSPKLTLLVSASGLSLLSFGVLSGAIIQRV